MSSDEVLDEARGWISDCGGDVDTLSDREVLAVIGRRYCGGVEGFVSDQLPGPNPKTTRSAEA